VDLEAVMGELEVALATVSGLRVITVGDKATPPAAFITYPDGITFDVTYGRGSDSMELMAVVLVGRTVARETRKALAAYCEGSGSASVKAALEAYTYTSAEVVNIPHVDFDVHTVAGVDYMAAVFTIEITGQGA
jgi:hypothetical protein